MLTTSPRPRRCTLLLVTTALWALSVGANEAGTYYEDAVQRFARRDYEGTVLQLKNVLQHAPKHLPALVLLGETYNAVGNGAAAETALDEAAALGADASMTAVPLARARLLQFKNEDLLKQAMPEGLDIVKRAEFLSIQAEAALQISDRERLERFLAEIDRVDPGSIPARAIRATLAMREGRPEDAERQITLALEASPDDPLALLTRASLHHVRDESAAALADYARIIELDPKNADARLARLGLLLDLGREAEMGEDLEYLGRHKQADPRLQWLRALKLERAGDAHGARSALSETANTLEAIGRARVMRNLQLLLVGGMVNYKLDKLEAARSYLEAYIPHATTETETRRMLAATLLRQGEFARASKLLEEIVEMTGGSPEILTMLARAYSGAGKAERAAVTLQRAVALRPDDPQLQTTLALSWADRGQADQAIAALEKVYLAQNGARTAGIPLAVLHLNRGEHAAARSIAERLVTDNEQDLTALNLLGIAELGLGRMEDARTHFERALAVNPDYRPAELNLGKLERRTGNFAAAEQRFTALMAARPQDPQLMLELARTHAAKGDAKAALRWGADALEAAPDSFEIALFLVETYLRQEDYERAWDTVFDQLKLHPKNLFVLEAQARVFEAQGKADDVRTVLRHMAEYAEFDSDWLLRIANHQVRTGHTADARYTLTKAVQSRPDSLDARALLAAVELRLGQPAAAAEIAEALREEAPENPAGHALLGDVAVAEGRAVDAAAHFREALARSAAPDGELTLKLHLALRQAGESAAAAEILTSWLAREPDALWATGALAEHRMATGDYTSARALFEAFLERRPDDAPTINNYANLLINTGDYDAALIRARRAFELAPHNPVVNDTLGWALVRNGQSEEALPYLREARTRAANLPEIRYHLAVALHKLGRSAEAVAELEGALSAAGDFEGREEAVGLLAGLKS
jgi:putative PEP-CTERM system TPR-repeat lipoprotein